MELPVLDYEQLKPKGKLHLDPLVQHAAAMARGADCETCPLYGCGEGPVMGDIVPSSPLTYIGEAPGHNEVAKGQVFIGASGVILDEAIAEGGWSRAKTTVTNTILCRPPGGDMQVYLKRLRSLHKIAKMIAKDEGKPSPAEPSLPSECCQNRLVKDLEESNSVVVCAVGSEALRAMARIYSVPHGSEKAPPGTPRLANMKKQHGSPIVLPNGRVLMTSLHPAFAMHGSKEMMPVIKADLARAARIAMRGGKLDWSEPEFILDPSLDVAINVMDLMRTSGARVTVDIETDSANSYTTRLRCVGLGAVIDGREVIICVPIIHVDGGQWWTESARAQIFAALLALLEEAPLNGQHLAFDTLILLRYQLMKSRGKLWSDTLILHHDSASSELPHDLGFIAARNFEAPRWKDDADAKFVDHVSDYWLHVYNCKDVLGTMRLLAPLWNQTTSSMMTEAFMVDTQLAPVARDMGALGLNINEGIRRDLYMKLDAVRVARLADVRRIVGIPDFNPQSTKQVAHFLYVTNKLTPPFDADGKDWKMPDGVSVAWDDDEDEDELSKEAEDALLAATTNEEALLRLLDLGVSKQVADFIDAQLQFRGMAKILGTYIGYKANKDTGIIEDRMRMRGRILDEVWPTVSPDPLAILHVNWGIHVIPTGRWNSKINVQNYPERIVYDAGLYHSSGGKKGIVNTRTMVEAPPGHVLVGADYEQIELLLYAVQAGDQLILDAKARRLDLHAMNYANMMGGTNQAAVEKWYQYVVALEAIDPKLRKHVRNIAKRFVFLCLYGGQEDRLFKTMSADRNPDGTRSFPGLDPQTVSFWFKNWHRTHPWTQIWQRNVVAGWRQYGFVATIIDGRKRFFIGGEDATAIPNHTIQGSTSSIFNKGLIKIAKECPYQGWSALSGPILNVHDFLGLQVPERRAKEAEELLKTYMPYELQGMRFNVESKIAKSWDKV